MESINKKTSDYFKSGYFLADGGLETTLIFHHNLDLPHFAAFVLLASSEGRESLKKYYEPYLRLAAKHNVTYLLETPTWRANPDWGFKLGYNESELKEINRFAVMFVREIQEAFASHKSKILLSGAVGPRGDGYVAESCMTVAEALEYHSSQIRTFALADVDLVTGMTLNYSDEAIGIVRAAKSVNVPVVISFTVETDGKLPNGETLKEAIEKTDSLTGGYAEHFMINCAHPEHFKTKLKENGMWKKRIRGIRANASAKSHAELNESTTLDAGDKTELARNYYELKRLLPDLRIVGGCCGTDHTHLEEICKYVVKDSQEKFKRTDWTSLSQIDL